MQRKVLVPTLNKEAKKKCDTISKEKRKEILEQIHALEEKYLKQLEKIQILKAYFNVELDADDMYGIKDKKKAKKKREKKKKSDRFSMDASSYTMDIEDE